MNLITRYLFLLFLVLFKYSSGEEMAEFSRNIQRVSDGTGYLLLTPSRFLSGTNNRICISRFGQAVFGTGLAQIEISPQINTRLDRKDFNYVRHKPIARVRKSFGAGNGGCFDIMVPKSPYSKVWLHLRMRLDDLPNYRINAKREVSLQHESTLVVIQTDKPIYRAGETVRFRVLQLKPDLTPSQMPIASISIETPSELFGAPVCVAQWNNVSTQMGLIQLDFKLDKYATQGDWKISVKSNHLTSETISETYYVTDYVLPSFHINVMHQKNLLLSFKQIVWNICARYFYGEPVKGSIHIRVSSDTYDLQPISKLIELDNTRGCYNYSIRTKDLGFTYNPRDAPNIVIAEIAVKEQGSKTWQNTTAISQVVREVLKIDFINKNKLYLRPGIPYKSKVKVTDWNSNPVLNAKVQFCRIPTNKLNGTTYNNETESLEELEHLHQRYTETCDTVYTDSKGLAQSSFLLPNGLRARYLKMTAIILNHPLREYEFGLENKSLPSVSLYMNVWSSLSSIHMDIGSIVINPIGLKPGTKHMIPIYISYGTDKVVKAPTLHFVLVTRSGIIFRWGSTTQCPVPADESIPHKTIDYNVQHDAICYSAKESGNTGLFKINIPIKISHQMCPYSHVMTYFVHERELVVANKYLKVSDCFYHKVHQQWFPDTVPPSTPVRLQITAPGPALCATTSTNLALKYAASHHSVQGLIVHILRKFMDTRRNLTEDELLNDVCFRDSSGFRPVNDLTRSYYRNTLIAFKSSSVEIVSDLLPETKPCPEDYCALKPSTNEPAPLTTSKYPKERSYFPETWLWDLHLLYSNGTLDIKTTAPDEITRYESQVFCLSRSGIATSHLSLGALLKVFQPFFVELIVPKLVKRGEEVEIYYRVYNYMDSTIAVSVTLQSSAGAAINIPSVYKSGKIACLAPKAIHTEYLMITADKIGMYNISVHAVVDNNVERYCSVTMPTTLYDVTDKMVKTIHVEPEGFKMEIHKSALLCSDGLQNETEITWRLERVDAVPNSEKWIVSIVGDVAGQMSVNADKLLSLPMGCGEQNMALMAYNLVALDYLAASGELTDVLRVTALNNLMIGYQRQLSYHHSDGAFSAFGPSDHVGSTWLTAFTLKYLHRLQQQWDIGWNPTMMTAAQNWLLSMQMENGCFRNLGQVFHREMKGGLRSDSSNVALAAYIIISLVDADVTLKSSTLQNALYCLTALKFKPENLRRTHPELGKDTDLIYTFVLSTLAQIKMDMYQSKSARNEVNSKSDPGNSSGETGVPSARVVHEKIELSNETIHAVKLLQSVAKRSDDLVWWEADTLGVSIETTSYGILCLLALGETSAITDAIGAVKWLSIYRSRKGGFVSTQDTLIALEAINAVGKYLPHITYGIDIALTGPSLRRHFAIRPKDRYDLNTFVIEDLNSRHATGGHRLKIQARGSGCVMVQATQSYSTLKRDLGEQKSPFVIYSKMTTDGAFDCKANTSWCKCAGILEICLFWSNPSSEDFPEMAIMEVGLPTAYAADKTLLYQLIKKDNILLRRIEMTENPTRLIFYLAINSLQVSPRAYECYSIFLVGPKLYTAPSFIKIYDYYHPERNVSEAYTIPEDCPFNGNRRPHNEPLIDMVNSDNLYGPSDALNSKSNEPQPAAPHPIDPPPTETIKPKLADPLDNFHTVDSDMDLEFPDGLEGPIPQIVKAPSNFNWDYKEVDNFKFADDIPASSMNSPVEHQTWTQMDMDMDVPEGIEGNVSVWVLPENFTSAHTPPP